MLILLYGNYNFLKKIYFNSIITLYVIIINIIIVVKVRKNTLNYLQISKYIYIYIFSDKCQVPNKCFELVDLISENSPIMVNLVNRNLNRITIHIQL